MVFDVIKALGRRWYVVLIGALLTASMMYGGYVASPPDYTARALILMLPSESAVAEGGNPLLLMDGLEQPASIVVAYFASASAKDEIAAFSPTAEFTMALDSSTRGPVIAIDVTNTTRENTLDVLNHLVDQVPVELTRLQEEVQATPASIIGSMPLVVDQKAAENRSGTIRLLIAALAVGLVITGVAAYGVDSVVTRRRLAREGESADLPTGRRARRRRRSASVEDAADESPDKAAADESDEGDPVDADAQPDRERVAPIRRGS